jgi:uncharacterized damage-inducible protein DinB
MFCVYILHSLSTNWVDVAPRMHHGGMTMHPADRELLDHFRRTRDKTIELVACIPEDLLGRTSPGESGPLHRLLAHAGCSESWKMANLLRDGQGPNHSHPPDRAGLVAEITRCRDRVLAFFEADDGANLGRVFHLVEQDGTRREWTGRNRLLYFIDHEVHHRGKVVLALRQYGSADIPFMPF